MTDLSIKVLVERYRDDLEQRGRSVTNATRVLFHLKGLPRLAGNAVNASSLGDDLREFRDQLAAKNIKITTVNRTLSVFRAALNAAADRDERITQRPWRTALRAVSGAETGVRNVILSDADRLKLRGAAYARDGGFGLLIDVLDETGARPSQAARLTADDVRDVGDSRRQPRLLMPVSAKGRGRKARTHIPVPITPELADRLKGRSSGLLLKRGDGIAWSSTNLSDCFDAAMKGVVFDNPARVTMYALRHTSIVRQLLAGVVAREAHHRPMVGFDVPRAQAGDPRLLSRVAREQALRPAQGDDPPLVYKEACVYALHFLEEKTDNARLWIECGDISISRDFVFSIEATRCLTCGSKEAALSLLEMAAAELRAELKRTAGANGVGPEAASSVSAK